MLEIFTSLLGSAEGGSPGGTFTIAYLLAGVLFIYSLGGLSAQETARRGIVAGLLGMTLALIITIVDDRIQAYSLILPTVIVGGVIGAVLAKRVAMTAMPELVAILHSFVGLAAVLVGISNYMDQALKAAADFEAQDYIHMGEIWAGVAVGGITFSGSVIAWAKLRGSVSGKPLLLPGRHVANALMGIFVILSAVPFMQVDSPSTPGMVWLLAMTAISLILGVHLVMSIGGADMPVVVSLLNSYSGWAAAAAGFMLENDLLIITGALVGSSGAILSIIMCRAMNRSIINVVFGGFGTGEGGAAPAAAGEAQGEVQETTADELAEVLRQSDRVIIVPGYGMAVARAQHLVHDFEQTLRDRGKEVRYAIHPVAGRLPGHMNVLLAEAGVSYEIVLEMDEINPDFEETDVVLVIGANDIVNPSALTDESSPIYGMPVLEAWKSKQVVIFKRGMATGYAGVDNPLFFYENTRMLFGDAKSSMEALVDRVRQG